MKQCLSVGMKMDMESLSIMDMEAGAWFGATFKSLKEVTPDEFDKMVNHADSINKRNETYHEKIKAAAEETRRKEAELEKQQEKLKLDKVSVFKDKLEGIGFKFTPGATIEDGVFSLMDTNEKYQVYVHGLLENEAILDVAILAAENYKKLQEKKQAEKEELHKLEIQRSLNNEARKKKMSRTDLAKLDPFISDLLFLTERIRATNFELIDKYVLPFVEGIETNIDTLNKATKHLRNN